MSLDSLEEALKGIASLAESGAETVADGNDSWKRVLDNARAATALIPEIMNHMAALEDARRRERRAERLGCALQLMAKRGWAYEVAVSEADKLIAEIERTAPKNPPP